MKKLLMAMLLVSCFGIVGISSVNAQSRAGLTGIDHNATRHANYGDVNTICNGTTSTLRAWAKVRNSAVHVSGNDIWGGSASVSSVGIDGQWRTTSWAAGELYEHSHGYSTWLLVK